MARPDVRRATQREQHLEDLSLAAQPGADNGGPGKKRDADRAQQKSLRCAAGEQRGVDEAQVRVMAVAMAMIEAEAEAMYDRRCERQADDECARKPGQRTPGEEEIRAHGRIQATEWV